jgi:hypothetical protein
MNENEVQSLRKQYEQSRVENLGNPKPVRHPYMLTFIF